MAMTNFIKFLFRSSGGIFKLFLNLRYWKFMIPFIIACLSLSASFVTSLNESIETQSYEPMILEMGGRITTADTNLIEDARALTTGEGNIWTKASLIQKFIGDIFIVYVLLFFFYKLTWVFLGNTNAPGLIIITTLFLYSMFHILFSLLIFQTVTFPLAGVIKSGILLFDYVMTL